MPFKPAEIRRVTDAIAAVLPEPYAADVFPSPDRNRLTVRIPDPKDATRTVAQARWDYETTKRMMKREQPLAADLAQTAQGLAAACGQYRGR